MGLIKNIATAAYGNDKRPFFKRIGFAFFVDFVFAVSIFAFIPYETYLGNTKEFVFKLSDFFAPILLTLIVFILTFAVHLLLKGKLFNIYTSLVFGITLVSYIQSLFLNGLMKSLNGTADTRSNSKEIINLILWIAILIVPLIISFLRENIWSLICKLGSLIIIGAQIVALFSMLLTAKSPNIQTVISNKGLYDLSGKNNVIVFVLDMFDQGYVEAMLEMHPDAMDELKGFTYYPNATCKYTFTHLGVPYLLSGEGVPEYNPTDEQYAEQIDNSKYFNFIVENVDNVDVYTQEICIRSNDARAKIDNCIQTEYTVSNKKLMLASLKASLYRVAPFKLKQPFVYDATTFNEAVEIIEYKDVAAFRTETHETDAAMMEHITQNGLSIGKNYGDDCLKFIHLKGTHVAYQLTEDVKFTEEPTSLQNTAAGSLALVAEYCKALDKLGLFDDATIIVTADHGLTWVWQNLEVADRAVTPLFLYKPAGVTRAEDLKTNLSPVAQDDIFPTVVKAFGGDSSEFGKTIEEASKDTERTRYYWAAFQDPEITDKESCIHVEYEITGDSRNLDNWKQTGVIVYPHYNPRHKDNK